MVRNKYVHAVSLLLTPSSDKRLLVQLWTIKYTELYQLLRERLIPFVGVWRVTRWLRRERALALVKLTDNPGEGGDVKSLCSICCH